MTYVVVKNNIEIVAMIIKTIRIGSIFLPFLVFSFFAVAFISALVWLLAPGLCVALAYLEYSEENDNKLYRDSYNKEHPDVIAYELKIY